MAMLGLWQVAATPGWVGPTVAISLAVVALSFLAIAIGVLIVVARLAKPIRRASEVIDGVEDDAKRALTGVHRVTEQAQDVLVLVRQEAGAFAATGKRLRRQAIRGADRLQMKLEDLETLYDVVHEEVEDTALDVAAALRSVRRGNGMLGRVRRLLIPARR
ncbi:MAG TPA: hypothetical protein VFK09_01960 [Gemmatimonadales bacterium]|jgi:uncharacterized protein YoxC|nr:hypothetical protein [Gemmatimonadales bacterium]